MSPGHWFEPLADHLGEAYLRYSFTKGTTQEVDALVELLLLEPGARVLDVGCGPGRHAHELARRGVEVVGLDVRERFVAIARAGAPAGASFVVGDARAMDFDAEFDAAYSLCQGAFGLLGGPAADADDPEAGDLAVLDGLRRAVRPGGRVAVSAFNAYFQIAHLDGSTHFDARTGVHHERTEIRDPEGAVAEVDLWTTCSTPRELRLLAARAQLDVLAVHGVTPGRYGAAPPSPDLEELLLLARRGGG